MRTPLQQSLFAGNRRVVWFSCGIASACVAKLATQRGACEVVYCDTSQDEHSDNVRFMRDVEQWIGQQITVIRSRRFATVNEVAAICGYISGVYGAKCTTELKKLPRHEYEQPGDIHLFGFTADEQHRIDNFEANNPELYLEWILRDAAMTKSDCHAMVLRAGIEIPIMYRLGYRNNNCRGCVKAQSPSYWNAIRRDFPDVFQSRAAMSRAIGARLVRLHGERIFLDELPIDTTEEIVEDLSCGPQCGLPGVDETDEI